MLLTNIRFMHMDEKNWDRPEDFNPNRWLDSSSATRDRGGRRKPELIHHHSAYIPYGLGERRCTGEGIAKVGFLILAVSLLRNFWFEAEKGKEIPTLVGAGGFAFSPRPFNVVLNPRH
ncbi:MAG: cytochrome P450 [SAR324 cluster bacterium]|nr:cytochrome P450 [SAR324 cluster bacterium]